MPKIEAWRMSLSNAVEPDVFPDRFRCISAAHQWAPYVETGKKSRLTSCSGGKVTKYGLKRQRGKTVLAIGTHLMVIQRPGQVGGWNKWKLARAYCLV